MTPLVVNCASTWANQTSGSVGQKGGSLMLTAATVGATAGRSAAEGSAAVRRGRTSRESSTSVQLMSRVGVTNVDVLLLTGQNDNR